MPSLELFHIPPSFYSQVARLALEEKGAPWRSVLAPPGPPSFDTYQPWYVAIHPEMTVPAMRHGERTLGGSLAIARYVDAELPGPSLTPEDPSEMERWLTDFEGISVRELSYGAIGGALPQQMNAMRLRVLRRQRARTPALREAYDAKIADIEGFAANAADPVIVQGHRDKADALLDRLETSLAARPWVAGESYSLADVAWTVMVARLRMLGLAPLEGRPQLSAWYARVKARPSFRSADVWEVSRPHRILLAVLRRYAWFWALCALALTALLLLAR
ncbi:MAG: glutathione S-transferase family protein [Alphaproteobacteria bacterium]|nr:glutathione S-transferase family protein [Alphaproteobacteria bacterium]